MFRLHRVRRTGLYRATRARGEVVDVRIVQELLEDIFSEVDYDHYKYLKYGEEEGDEDEFPEMAQSFAASYAIMKSIRDKG